MWGWIPPFSCWVVFNLNTYLPSASFVFFLQKNVHLKKKVVFFPVSFKYFSFVFLLLLSKMKKTALKSQNQTQEKLPFFLVTQQ